MLSFSTGLPGGCKLLRHYELSFLCVINHQACLYMLASKLTLLSRGRMVQDFRKTVEVLRAAERQTVHQP